jgi:hypothetical protein
LIALVFPLQDSRPCPIPSMSLSSPSAPSKAECRATPRRKSRRIGRDSRNKKPGVKTLSRTQVARQTSLFQTGQWRAADGRMARLCSRRLASPLLSNTSTQATSTYWLCDTDGRQPACRNAEPGPRARPRPRRLVSKALLFFPRCAFLMLAFPSFHLRFHLHLHLHLPLAFAFSPGARHSFPCALLYHI